MSRRFIVAAAVAGLIAVTASAADTTRSTPSQPVSDPADQTPAPAQKFDLRALFDRAPGVLSDDSRGMTVGAFAVEVLVARRGPDGKLIKACVNSEEAARLFLSAPIDKVATKKAKEN